MPKLEPPTRKSLYCNVDEVTHAKLKKISDETGEPMTVVAGRLVRLALGLGEPPARPTVGEALANLKGEPPTSE